MIEINQRAKPKPYANPIPLALGLFYLLRNGMVMHVYAGDYPGAVCGIIKTIPADMPTTLSTNPAMLKEGNVANWNGANGAFLGYEHTDNYPYHVAGPTTKPPGVPDLILHTNEPAEALWHFHQHQNGELQYTHKPPSMPSWAPYYTGLNKQGLTLGLLKLHLQQYWIRRKP